MRTAHALAVLLSSSVAPLSESYCSGLSFKGYAASASAQMPSLQQSHKPKELEELSPGQQIAVLRMSTGLTSAEAKG